MKEMNGDTTNANPLKAIDILESLSQSPNGATLSDLAESTGLNRSSVYRIVMALVQRNYVHKDNRTKIYRLGFRPLQFAGVVLDSLEVKHLARSEMRRIAETTNETVHLFCPDGMEAVYVDIINTPNPVGLKSQIGKRVPLYCTAGGKALLAHMETEFVEDYAREVQFIAYTPTTITSPVALLTELKKVRLEGYAIDNEEHHLNVTCIAVPLIDKNGEIVASISVSAPTYRFSVQQALSHKDFLKQCAKNISQQLI